MFTKPFKSTDIGTFLTPCDFHAIVELRWFHGLFSLLVSCYLALLPSMDEQRRYETQPRCASDLAFHWLCCRLLWWF